MLRLFVVMPEFDAVIAFGTMWPFEVMQLLDVVRAPPGFALLLVGARPHDSVDSVW